MDNKIQILKDTELLGQRFVVYGTPSEPLFLAKDVAAWIDYDARSINKLVAMVDDEEKVRNILPTLGGCQEAWFLTEDGLYEVLMQSRKPIAKMFKRGVKDILREIRKTGGYMVMRDDETEEELMARALSVAQVTLARREARLRMLEEENAELSEKVAVMKPKVDYCDKILNSPDPVAVTQISKDYGMSPQEFNKRLHALGIQYKVNGQWLLYAKYQCMGYTVSHTGLKKNSNGTWMATVWTQKGRIFLYNELKSVGVLPIIERYSGYNLPPIAKINDEDSDYWQ